MNTRQIEEKIIAMWAQGMSGGTISMQLGLTRGSVLGIIHRLRKRGVKVERAPDAEKTRVVRNTGASALACASSLVPQGALTLERLTPTTCRWPYGDVYEERGVRYCGAYCTPDATYCREHHALSYTKRAPPERVARKMSKWGNMRVMPD